MNKKTYIIGAVVIVLALIAGIASLEKESQPQHLTIGAALSLTGMAAVDGEHMKEGIELARKHLKEDGIELEVIYEDDGTEPGQTVGSINKLVDIHGVTAIIGPTWSFLSAAAASTIQEKQVVSYNPANTSEHVEGKSDYFLFGAPKNSLKEDPTTAWLQSIGAKRVAIVVDAGAWGESHIKPFTNATERAGAELVLVERTPFGTAGPEMQTIVAKIMNENVDAVLYTGFDQDTAAIVQKKQVLGAPFQLLVATEIVRQQQKDGVITLAAEDNIFLLIPETSHEFETMFEASYGYAPGPYADRAYDGTMMIAKAMLEKPDDVSLNEYIRIMHYEGYMGTYTFDENNDLSGGVWYVEQLK